MSNPSLLPKEYGAYAQLAFPMVTGLALAAPSFAALALGAAAVVFFLANEPATILLGGRGKRLQDQLGSEARKRAILLLGSGVILGTMGAAGGGARIWHELLFPVLAGALLIPLVLAGRQKTLLGEFLVITAFSTLILPLAAASGADPNRAQLAAGVWWISFALATLEVHAIKARNRSTARSRWTRWSSSVASALGVGGSGALALGWWDPAWAGTPVNAGLALLPPAVAVLGISLLPVHPRHLKRVGWSLVGANALALAVLLRG